MGITPVSKAIQLNDMDIALRNGLWNVLKRNVLDILLRPEWGSEPHYELRRFAIELWDLFFKLPIDQVPINPFHIEQKIREFFFDFSWELVYDFVEFLASEEMEEYFDTNSYEEAINKVLTREASGYRLVTRLVVPISNDLELEEIDSAIKMGVTLSGFDGVNIHLSSALQLFSDRQAPDYRNSIKESVSAVESAVRVITGESTLGEGLKRLREHGINIDNQLKSAFEKLYAYSNNKSSGIRHSIVEEPQAPDFEDAKYMLVTCCAFINYLVGKTAKAGLSF